MGINQSAVDPEIANVVEFFDQSAEIAVAVGVAIEKPAD